MCRCKKRYIGKVLWTIMIVVSLLWLCPNVMAEDMQTYDMSAETFPEVYGELEEAIPDDIAELLPDGLFSREPQTALDAANTMTKPQYLLRSILQMTGLYVGDVVTLLLTLLGLILLSALLRHAGQALHKGGEGFLFCLRLCMYSLMIGHAIAMMSWVSTYFERLQTLMGGLIPVMGVLYTLGGNVSQAAVSHEMLWMLLAVCGYIATTVTPALCGICLAFTLMEAFGGQMQVTLTPLSGLCKKWYTSLLGFLVFLLTTALSVQSVLAVKADTLGMKGVKYAVGNMLPVVGGAVSGALGSVAASVGLLRGIAGVSGVILLLLLLLPTLIQLLLYRACYQLSSAISGMLGCDAESKLLSEVGSLYGYMAATVSICTVGFLVALGIFTHGATALDA